MHLVQRHFQHPRHDLRGTGQAGSRCQHQGQAARRQAALVEHLVDHHLGRSSIHLEHQYAAVAVVTVAEFGEQVFAYRQGPCRPRTEGEELLAASLLLARGQTPASILAAEARQHRPRAGHLEPVRPALAATGCEADAAETAHADLADQKPCLDAAGRVDAGIDDGHSARELLDQQAQFVCLRQQARDQRRRQRIDAEAGAGYRSCGIAHVIAPSDPSAYAAGCAARVRPLRRRRRWR